jgi:hypothetical protein
MIAAKLAACPTDCYCLLFVIDYYYFIKNFLYVGMHLSGSAIVCTELAACPTVWWRWSEEQNFFILIFFNKYLRNEFRQKFF